MDDREKLLHMRKTLLLTQASMAAALNLPARTYQDLEAGIATTRPIHLASLERLRVAHIAGLTFAKREATGRRARTDRLREHMVALGFEKSTIDHVIIWLFDFMCVRPDDDAKEWFRFDDEIGQVKLDDLQQPLPLTAQRRA